MCSSIKKTFFVDWILKYKTCSLNRMLRAQFHPSDFHCWKKEFHKTKRTHLCTIVMSQSVIVMKIQLKNNNIFDANKFSKNWNMNTMMTSSWILRWMQNNICITIITVTKSIKKLWYTKLMQSLYVHEKKQHQ